MSVMWVSRGCAHKLISEPLPSCVQTAGMIGLMALGGPETEAIMGAEEGLGAESLGSKAMTSAEKEALETKYLSDSPMNPDFKPVVEKPVVVPLREAYADEYVTSSGSSGSEGLLRTSMNPHQCYHQSNPASYYVPPNHQASNPSAHHLATTLWPRSSPPRLCENQEP